jgi:hypothetical protein
MTVPKAVSSAFASAAGETLGRELAASTYRLIEEKWKTPPGETIPRAAARDIETYLSGGVYVNFVADRVIRDAFFRFAGLPEQERVVLFATLRTTHPDPQDLVREIVRYMATR